MKILYITSSLNINDGWGRYSHALINEISKTNEVFVLSNIDIELSGVKQKAVLYSPLSVANPFKILKASKEVKNVIKNFDPDIVHFITEPYVLILPFLKLDKKVKTFLTVHGTYSFMPHLYKSEKIKLVIVGILVKIAFKKISNIIAVSEFTKDFLIEKYKKFYNEDFPHNKIQVISNGIDLRSFPVKVKNINNKIKKIVFVGAVKRRKGILEAIRALALYKNNHNGEFEFIIVGSYNDKDEYVIEVKEEIKKLMLGPAVTFKGRVSEEELRLIYADADLFMLLSTNKGLSLEGFGLVYLEANAYGVPVIGTKDSGASEAILDGKTGYLVDPYDPNMVSERIYSILVDKSISQEDCVDWVKKHDVRDKVKIVMDYYKS